MAAWLRGPIALGVGFVSGVIAFFGIAFLVARSGGCPPDVHTCDVPGMAGFAAGLLAGPIVGIAAAWTTFSRLGGLVRQRTPNAPPPNESHDAWHTLLPSWVHRLVAGATAGALVGAVFPLTVLFMSMFTVVFGKVFLGNELRLAAYTMFGFALAGAVVGLLRPVARTPLTRFLVGVVGAAIAATFTLWTIAGPLRGWGMTEMSFVCSVAIVAGGFVARALRNSPV